ncbi:HAD-IIB family hydrolase [Verrucomicrobiaceae bacterium 5K15]|uniref:HAD-IIB family hydrolase n=1 Tax=Oceaniferula flava TaxID=2800421 RepID=A0AAE2SCS7_9BACT|nr:HAD-IIB family hydrolase [Oceaniferula flavus]MBK1854140.1 HAD-IIB family hydrolase [Oceaniferula flavus]MBM1135446.1 HAD-IIB family hydrolase [Oceaniferula flavus]
MKKLLIITDLDASFIDDNYQYSEAQEAIEQLAARDFPLIFNSSKTLAEIESLADELALTTPLIAENGGIVAVPESSPLAAFCDDSGWHSDQGYRTLITGLSRDFIIEHAHAARDEHGYQFTGFSDMSDQELSELTGLSIEAAKMARQRHVSEPILWKDNEENWERFQKTLHSQGIRTLRGGRFIHLMGPADKADGLQAARDLYQKCNPHSFLTTVALGDSANDQSMLEAADIGIIIPHADGVKVHPAGTHILQAPYPASKGWNHSILKLLSTFELTQPI